MQAELELAELAEKYEELQMEYVDLAEQADNLVDQNEALSFEYDRLLEQLKWTHGMLSILLEEQGGVVQVSKSIIENYDLNASAIKVYEDVESETYIIEVDVTEEAEIVSDVTV